jgi:hypothetical protein
MIPDPLPDPKEAEAQRLFSAILSEGVITVYRQGVSDPDILERLAFLCHQAGRTSDTQYLHYLAIPRD